MFDKKEHWEKIYTEKKPEEVSWFQTQHEKSLELVKLAGTSKGGSVIDVGAGASVLVDRLLEVGFTDVTVLDISKHSLEYAKARLGEEAERVKWVVADVTEFSPSGKFDLWHDRAVFHFLTEKADREKYVDLVSLAVKPGGHLILASFAPDGPEKCSGLPVRRYDSKLIMEELGSGFKLLRHDVEIHKTPWSSEQKFSYFLCEKK